MNKKLLIAAVGAALVAGPMLAAQANTTLYGHMHMSSDNVDNNNAKYGYISNNSSRVGIKGDEDLGGGLKAIYQVEDGIVNVDTGVNGMGNTLRNSYLGFSGSWGAVKVGRYDSPFKELGRKLDNFNEELGDMRNILSGSTSAASVYDNRINNMIRYESPNMSGLTVNFAHSSNDASSLTAEGPGGTGKSNNNLGVNWTSGPLFLGAAYQKLGYTQSATVTKDHDNSWRLAGAYTMDDLMVGLIYQDLKDIGGKDLSQKAMGVAASLKMANNMFKFHYLTADDLKGSAAAGALTDTGSKLWALGVDHTFSKTTKVYVDYAQAKNDNNTAGTSVISGNAGHGETLVPIANGKKVKGISAGMVLNF
jgi:predicted porin